MTPPLLRASTIPAEGGVVALEGAEARHAGSALRMRIGELIRIGDGQGVVADCEVSVVANGRVEAVVRVRTEVPQPTPRVTVVQALPKSERSELAVELATEAGADRILPWQAERCISRWTGAKVDKGRTKWAHAARAAAKQSRRPWEPEIGDLLDGPALATVVADGIAAGSAVLVLHEEGAVPLASAMSATDSPELVLVVGPEGGVSETELTTLTELGARPVVLGPEVLRTSTAAAVALGALGVLTARWSGSGTTLEPTPPSTGK